MRINGMQVNSGRSVNKTSNKANKAEKDTNRT